MTTLPTHPLRLSELSNRKDTSVTLDPTTEERDAIASELGLPALRKLRFEARLSPMGKRDWALDATLGATVVQDCVVTLDPVTTRIDETLRRQYLANQEDPEGSEVEMPEDDTIESLPTVLDVAQVMIEALSLALPAYPRVEAANLAEYVVTEPGATPLTQSQMKPFAGLAGLRDALKDAENDKT